MVRAAPGERIGVDVVGDAEVAELRMQEPVDERAVDHRAAADARTDGDVTEGVDVLRGAPPVLSERGGVHVGVEGDGHAEAPPELAGEIRVRPAGLGRGRHVSPRRRARPDVDGAEGTDADRGDWPFAFEERNRASDRLAGRRRRKGLDRGKVVGPGAGRDRCLRTARLDPAVDHHARNTITNERRNGVTYVPADDRYDHMHYRRCGRSGLDLPAISLGLWQNFGEDGPLERSRAIVRRAFDLGVTHFDLANNYGPPYGSAEETFGKLLHDDLRPYRDELVISTKAGYDMWPGPYGEWGSRKYVLASLDQSLRRLGLEYVDVFYSHRFDPKTPLEETMGALATAVKQGKALYAGISSYSAERTREAAAILRELGTPLLIHQPSYSMLNRWIEPALLDALGELGVGCIVFSPLAQGMLTDKYLHGIPEGARASRDGSLSPDFINDDNLARIRALNEIAARRGQSLAQLALAWTLRDSRVTSALVGASSVEQLEANVGALEQPALSDDELAEIDKHAVDSGINLWEQSSSE